MNESLKSSANSSSYWLAVCSLSQREIVRFLRQRTRVVGALGQPVIFWVLFGAGLYGSFQPPEWASADMTYQEYFFPGVAVMILLFTAIFSTISIIEDRREGFLQGVLVSPVPRSVIVFGKLIGGTILAVGQAILFLIFGFCLHWFGLAPEIRLNLTILDWLAVLSFMCLLGFTLTGLGYVIAWPMSSTQGFHAIMSVFLLPMWLLSGAIFPVGSTGWLSWVMWINPLTYGVACLRRLMYSNSISPDAVGLPGVALSFSVTLLFCLVCVMIATQLTNRRSALNTR
ncbi:MAG: ABC transporter permease [Planctomycetaceae bacterium]|jgi:ABC-2 type transport system permease protein|nr:ABC transporter permease [bacterium]MDB4786604.1 ABC transporter permease [Planctomycetaceae bacterium]MDC0308397.1 ABC transporter permease [Planctomycetaceae bacterium]MDG2389443.1 ABC transporter permease [Planctomycetaceae bacterium]